MAGKNVPYDTWNCTTHAKHHIHVESNELTILWRWYRNRFSFDSFGYTPADEMDIFGGWTLTCGHSCPGSEIHVLECFFSSMALPGLHSFFNSTNHRNELRSIEWIVSRYRPVEGDQERKKGVHCGFWVSCILRSLHSWFRNFGLHALCRNADARNLLNHSKCRNEFFFSFLQRNTELEVGVQATRDKFKIDLNWLLPSVGPVQLTRSAVRN